MSESPVDSPSNTPPARSRHVSPEHLTPRTKIRRMLTAFDDDDSDKENGSTRQPPDAKMHKQLAIPVVRSVDGPLKRAAAMRPFDDSESENDLQEQRGASGKATSDNTSAEAAAAKSHDASSDSENDGAEGAYQRIRGHLRRSNQPPNDQSSTITISQGRAARQNDRLSPSHFNTSRRSSLAHSVSRASSTSLFVSPSRPQKHSEDIDEDDEDPIAMSETRSRLQELVARKRKEREEKERAAEHSPDEDEESDSSSNSRRIDRRGRARLLEAQNSDVNASDVGERPTRRRPPRKAGKQAMEEMNRETQRMSRNMQLTHQAKTKIKFTTTDLFKKFNFRQPKPAESSPVVQTHTPGSSSPARINSDGEIVDRTGTPPSSPPSLGSSHGKHLPLAPHEAQYDDELPAFSDLLTQATGQPHKDRVEEPVPCTENHSENIETPAGPPLRPSLRSFMKSAKRQRISVTDDDDLEIVKAFKPSRIAALDLVQAEKGTEHESMVALRALAHLNDINHERRVKGSVTSSELNASLTRRAREQAKVAEFEKIQEAKDKGRYVESAEEKERNQMQIESMIERAQRENAELAKREKEMAKREGNGDADGLPDSDEDDDFQPSEGEDVAFSGSEDEVDAGEDGDVEDEDGEEDEIGSDDEHMAEAEAENEAESRPENRFVDDDAEEDSDSDADRLDDRYDSDADAESEQQNLEDEAPFQTPKPKPLRKSRVVMDEDESADERTPITPAPQAAKTPGSKTSIAEAFGFAQDKSPAVGLSQLWGGTMAESQTQRNDGSPNGQEDSLAFLRGAPQAQLMSFGDSLAETQDDLVQDSQRAETPALETPAGKIASQYQSALQDTQASPMLDATQDLGFETNFTPAGGAEQSQQPDSYSTIDTVPLPSADSPVMRRKSRPHRGRLAPAVQVESSDHEAEEPFFEHNTERQIASNNAFSVLQKGAKRAEKQAAFDKKQSEAKNMFEEQAEESEDEYAGLGGVSDDESGSDMDEEMQKLIDDGTKVKVNRGQAAHFHAEWERARDEKNTTKLYRDITTGALRRQRDNGADLLDWDDDDEREARRRAIRLRKEARQRKALVDSGKLETVMDNPKRQAFLSAVEDFAGDEEVMFLDEEDDDSQAQSRQPEPAASHKRKRDTDVSDNDEKGQSQADRENMPPPKSRRNNTARNPSTLEIRRTLSSLFDEAAENDPDVIADSQEDVVRGAYSTAGKQLDTPIAIDSDKENDSDLDFEEPSSREGSPDGTPPQRAPSPPKHRRTPATASKNAVIDRMALKRQSSSTSNTTANSGTRLAFAAQNSRQDSFKLPSLLRRATTNASMGSTDGSLAEKSAAAGITGVTKECIRKGGSKKSSVNWHVREKERMEVVERVEKERVAGRRKIGEMLTKRKREGMVTVGGGVFG